MIPNSPDFTECVPRLFIRITPGGNQSNGESRSRPAFVTNNSRSRGAAVGNRALITLTSQTNASASFIAAAKSADVRPIETTCSLVSGERATAASHMAREKSNSGSSSGL